MFACSRDAGCSLRKLQGPWTSQAVIERLGKSVREGTACTVCMVNVSKSGRPFSHSVTATPLGTGGTADLVRFTSKAIDVFGNSYGSLDTTGASIDSILNADAGSHTVDTTMATVEALVATTTTAEHHERYVDPAAFMPTFEGSLIAPCVVTTAEPPYSIVHANEAWLALCGFSAPEVLGVDLKCIQGPATSPALIGALMQHVRARQNCIVPNLVNFNKRRQPFRHTLQVEYVAMGDSAVFYCTSTDIGRLKSTLGGDERFACGTPAAGKLDGEVVMWSEELEDYIDRARSSM